MAKKRGLRSSNDARPWVCRCGVRNKPTKHRFFDLPAFTCRACNKKFTGDFKFCLGEIKVKGQSLVGEVLDQGLTDKCVPFAYSKAAEVTERLFNASSGKDPDSVEPIDPIDLHLRFEAKFPQVPSDNAITNHRGMHKILHMGLILRNEGIQRYQSPTLYTAADISTIPRDDFEKIAQLLAEGSAMVATYLPGKRRSRLRYCQIYKSPPLSRFKQKRAKENGHAVVLIGAGMKDGCQFFYFLNSWGKKFCARRNVSGEIVMGGIGKIRATDLTKNVVRLSRPDEAGVERRLEDQSDFDISDKNFILMAATKSQYTTLMARQGKAGSPKSRKVKKYDEFVEDLKDSWNDGVFHDDEGKCMQARFAGYQKNCGKTKRSRGSFEVRKEWVKKRQSTSGLQNGASCMRNDGRFFCPMPYDQDNVLMEIQKRVQQNMGSNLIWGPDPLAIQKQVLEPCPCKEFALTSSSEDDASEGLLTDKVKEIAGFQSGHLMSNDGEGMGVEANEVLVQDSTVEECRDAMQSGEHTEAVQDKYADRQGDENVGSIDFQSMDYSEKDQMDDKQKESILKAFARKAEVKKNKAADVVNMKGSAMMSKNNVTPTKLEAQVVWAYKALNQATSDYWVMGKQLDDMAQAVMRLTADSELSAGSKANGGASSLRVDQVPCMALRYS